MRASKVFLGLSLVSLLAGCTDDGTSPLQTQLTIKEALAECGQLDMSKVTRDDSDPRGLEFTVSGETSDENSYNVDNEGNWSGWSGQIPAMTMKLEVIPRGVFTVVWIQKSGLDPEQKAEILEVDTLTTQTCEDGVDYAFSSLEEAVGAGSFMAQLFLDEELLQTLSFTMGQ